MKKTKEEIIESMRTKESGSRAHKQLENQLKKQMKREQWYRMNKAKEYSVQLMKVFKNKLLSMI
jgi:hypothetical protein